MKDKTVLITGATAGLGLATAKALAKQGAKVIIVGRSAEKTEKIKQEIIQESGNQNIDSLLCDLFIQAEVRKLAETLNQKYGKLDVLINNAGGMMPKEREITADGVEKTIALNLFTPFLLMQLLLPVLHKSPEARIVNLTSAAHQAANPDFNDIQMERGYGVLAAYSNAKLYNILISQHLAKKLVADGFNNITVNTLNPGTSATSFLDHDYGWLINLIGKLTKPFFRTVEKGAETVIYLASSPEVKGVSGKYFEDCKPIKVKAKYDTEVNEQKIWAYCEQQTKAV